MTDPTLAADIARAAWKRPEISEPEPVIPCGSLDESDYIVWTEGEFETLEQLKQTETERTKPT